MLIDTLPPLLYNTHKQPIRIGASAKWYEFPDKFELLAELGLQLEYTPDMNNLEALPVHLEPYLLSGITVRHHAFFPGLELGDVNSLLSNKSYELHIRMLQILAGYGEQVVTVHIGLDPSIQLCPQKAVENLSNLVEEAAKLGITLSLENLRRGPTSNPHLLLEWATRSGSAITLDIGHVLCSDYTRNGGPGIIEVIDIFSSRLAEVHFYERETDRHYPPADMTILGPIVDALRTTSCDWWTIELGSVAEIEATCGLLRGHLEDSNQ